MSRVNQKKQFESLAGGAITTTAPAPVISGQGFPTGNLCLEKMHLGINQNLTIGTGTTPATDGELLLIDSIYVDSDKHGPIIENVDGLGLHRMLQFIYGTRPLTTAIAATTGNYFSGFDIPLILLDGMRPFDTALDLYNSRMSARVTFNDLSKAFGTVGTATSTPTVTWSGDLLYAPKEPDELPIYMPVFKLKKVPITATQTQYAIPLDYGGLIYLAIGIAQRNTSTLAEFNNTAITASSKVRLDVNGRDAVLPMDWRDIQDMTKTRYGIETVPTGWGVLDFFTRTGSLNDAIDTVGQQGNMNLLVDVTTAANTAVWVYSWALKPIPPTALRASQIQKS
jgi:hypothetical protein